MRARSSTGRRASGDSRPLPSSMHRTTLSSSSRADTMTTGMCRVAPDRADALEHLIAVHLGHQDVEQHDVDGLADQRLERLAPVLRGHDAVAVALEAAPEQRLFRAIVVDDEDGRGCSANVRAPPASR